MSRPECCEDCALSEGDEHVCPYDEDVNNDPASMCDCCEACTQECANDI